MAVAGKNRAKAYCLIVLVLLLVMFMGCTTFECGNGDYYFKYKSALKHQSWDIEMRLPDGTLLKAVVVADPEIEELGKAVKPSVWKYVMDGLGFLVPVIK